MSLDYKVTGVTPFSPTNNTISTHVQEFIVEWKETYHKVMYCCKRPDFTGKTIVSDERPFSGFFDIVKRFVKPGSVAIDIGAYDGDTTIPLSILVGETGVVLAFEPHKISFARLSVNMQLNPRLNIRAYPYAVMPTAGRQTFLYASTDDNGGHPSTNSWVGTYDTPYEVDCINLEDFFKDKCPIENISFIKTDTEGHDFNILISMSKIMTIARPVIHAEWFPKTQDKLLEFLFQYNYLPFSGFTLEPITEKSKWTMDIVLVPKEKMKMFGLTHNWK